MAAKAFEIGSLKEMEELIEHLKKAGGRDREDPKAATRDVAMELVRAREQKLAVGDIVVWRKGMKDARFPLYGEECVVTQSLETPLRGGDPGTPGFAERLDIAIALTTPCGDLSCEGDHHVLEYMHDSRRFEKVSTALN